MARLHAHQVVPATEHGLANAQFGVPGCAVAVGADLRLQAAGAGLREVARTVAGVGEETAALAHKEARVRGLRQRLTAVVGVEAQPDKGARCRRSDLEAAEAGVEVIGVAYEPHRSLCLFGVAVGLKRDLRTSGVGCIVAGAIQCGSTAQWDAQRRHTERCAGRGEIALCILRLERGGVVAGGHAHEHRIAAAAHNCCAYLPGKRRAFEHAILGIARAALQNHGRLRIIGLPVGIGDKRHGLAIGKRKARRRADGRVEAVAGDHTHTCRVGAAAVERAQIVEHELVGRVRRTPDIARQRLPRRATVIGILQRKDQRVVVGVGRIPGYRH